MIQLVDVSKIYRDKKNEKVALDKINITLPDHGMVFIIGRSGSGKSTLLNITAGLDNATSGKIYYDGQDIGAMKESVFDSFVLNSIGFVFQDYCLIEDVSVRQNIAFGLLDGVHGHEKEIDEILTSVGLKGYKHRLGKELSGGEKQRVAVARALIKHPKIIFSDEPTGNLDEESSKKVLQILKKESQKSLVLIVSHNLNNAYEYGDRVITLDNGKIIDDTSYSGAKRKKKGTYYLEESLLSDKDRMEKLNGLIQKNDVKELLSRRSFFEETKEGKEEKSDFDFHSKYHFRCFGNVFRLFNKRLLKSGLFSFLSALAFALFAVCLSFQSFDRQNYEMKAIKKSGDSAFIIEKQTTSTGSGWDDTIYSINDQISEKLEEAYPNETFPLYNIPIGASSSAGQLASDRPLNPQSYRTFYAYESRGVVVASETFLKQALNLETIEYDYWNPTQKKSGLFVTDYFADSYISGRQLNGGYSNFVKSIQTIASPQGGYWINGIIKTDYRERFKDIRTELRSNGLDHNILLNEKNYSNTVKLMNYYNVCYSLEPDFISAYLNDFDTRGSVYVYNAHFPISKDQGFMLRAGGYTHSKEVKDDEIYVRYEAVASLTERNDAATLEEYLNNRFNDQGGVSLSLKQNINGNSHDFVTFPNMKIKIIENHQDILKSATYGDWSEYIVSENVYKRIKTGRLCKYGIYMDDSKKMDEVRTLLKDDGISISNPLTVYLNNVTKTIESFSKAFRILSYACLVMAVVVLLFYSIDVIKSQRYNIGTLKALGMKNWSLSKVFGLTTFNFSVFSSLFFLLFYDILCLVLNKVILHAFINNWKGYSFVFSDILTFNWLFAVMSIVSLSAMTILISLVTLILVIRIKPVQIIRNKN